jgi:SSS family solute:Na+ symporter
VLPRIQYGNIHWGKGINIGRDLIGIVYNIPLIAGIMGLKTDSNSFFISMLATFVTFLIGKLFLPDLWFMPMVIVVNAVTFLGAHYIQNKRFVTVKRDTITLA